MTDGTNKALVIGAGPSGLAAAAALRRHGIDFELHERHSDVGGLWDIENPGSPMYQSAHFISSKYLSFLDDMPMPETYPDYPSNRDLLAYLRSFAKSKDLTRNIVFNSEISRAEKIDGGWRIIFADGRQQTFRWLITAAGTNWHPFVPEIDGTFSGTVIHSNQYHSADMLAGKRVLVVGAGNSGCDIACDAARLSLHSQACVRQAGRCVCRRGAASAAVDHAEGFFADPQGAARRPHQARAAETGPQAVRDASDPQ
jgi:cation diffusion facilitator CzcD-associated flavoprotein CzcO